MSYDFDYFWKPINHFSKFCVNCLLRFHFVYCKNCILNDVNGACYCTCSLVTLRVPEMCFWFAEKRKNFKHMRCIHIFDLVLKYCSDKNEVNWLRLLFYFIELTDMVTSAIGRCFFFLSLFQVLEWNFLALQRQGDLCNWKSKLFWPGPRFWNLL